MAMHALSTPVASLGHLLDSSARVRLRAPNARALAGRPAPLLRLRGYTPRNAPPVWGASRRARSGMMERLQRWYRGPPRPDAASPPAAAAASAAPPPPPSASTLARDKQWGTVRVAANIGCYVLQLAAANTNALTGTGLGIGGVYASGGPLCTLLQPATWAFFVWFPIYTASAGYVIWQALPSNSSSPLARRSGWWALLAWTFLALWGAVASASPNPNTATVQAVLLVFMLGILRAAWLALHSVAVHPAPLSATETWCVAAPFSALAAWITVATVLNVGALALVLGASSLAYASTTLAPAALCVAALGALCVLLVLLTEGNPFFSAVLVWGLAGIAAAAARPGYAALQAVAAIAATAVALAALYALSEPRGPRTWGPLTEAAVALRQSTGLVCQNCGAASCCCAPEAGEERPLLESAAPPASPKPRARLGFFARVKRALGYGAEESPV